MKKYYVTEIFYSMQGEGLRIGVPSVFVRLFGCNLTCQGFGMPAGEMSNERELAYDLIKTRDITSIEQLPLVTTGCDSYVAWDKRFRHLSKHMTLDEIIESIIEVTPDNSLRDIDVVFTGGEPMLQQDLLIDMSSILSSAFMLRNITIETNGTKQPNEDAWRELVVNNKIEVLFSVSQKLDGSGESVDKRINFDSLDTLFNKLNHFEHIRSVYKFVVSSGNEIDEINLIIEKIRAADESFIRPELPIVYLMSVGGTKEQYLEKCRYIAGLAMKNSWRYSPRLHIDVFGNEWAT